MNHTPGLDVPGITLLVDLFYDRIREHPSLGPVFASRVDDWNAHKRRLVAFWCSTALRAGSYRGNPMQMHRDLPVNTSHFRDWLSLWQDTVGEVMPEPAASTLVELAERIGHGLMLGMGLRPRGRELGIPLAGRWSSDRSG